MVIGGIGSPKTLDAPKFNEVGKFAQQLESYVETETPIETLDFLGENYSVMASPFKRGTALIVYRRVLKEGRILSVFPAIYPNGNFEVSTIFTEKTPRITMKYRGEPDNEEIYECEISRFDSYSVAQYSQEWISEGLKRFLVDKETGEFKLSGLELRDYLKNPLSKTKMYTMKRKIESDPTRFSGRMYQDIDTSVSHKVWLKRDFSGFGGDMGSETFYYVSTPVLIIKPPDLRGKPIVNEDFSGIVKLFDDLRSEETDGNKVYGSLSESEKRKLFDLQHDRLAFPTFLDSYTA